LYSSRQGTTKHHNSAQIVQIVNLGGNNNGLPITEEEIKYEMKEYMEC